MKLDTAAVSSAVADLLGVYDLRLVVKPEWSSSSKGHRELIRADLDSQIANFLGVSSSISHSKELGGYAFLNLLEWQVGFDIEAISRATAPIVRRICQDDLEFSSAPSTAALWCAKESSFKCMRGPDQPIVVADIRIHNWVRRDEFWLFDFRSEKLNGQGISWSAESTQFALAFLKI